MLIIIIIKVREREKEKVIQNRRQICEKNVCMTCCVSPYVQCECETEKEKVIGNKRQIRYM